jgi:5-methylcytosine-specific restriction endonuclease McrA
MIWNNKILQVREKHPNWNGGEFAGRGILERYGRKMMCARCGTNDERILMVHHKNGNRKNNKITNLIWLCQNCHHLVHYYDEKIS